MPTLPPTSPLQSVKDAPANGILSAPASTIKDAPSQKAGSENPTAHESPTALPPPRLKVVLRRLAPKLTQEEFEKSMGNEWKVGEGKVDWMSYMPGKLARDLNRPSRPSRAYFHLTDQRYLSELLEKVRNTSFDDASNTSFHVGPPSLEFAPFQRVFLQTSPEDSRQGTIDQDPEFKAFLESLTAPLTKPTLSTSAVDASHSEKEAPKTTPLIEHLREKKIAKERVQASKTAVKANRQQVKETGNENQIKKPTKKEGRDNASVKEKAKKDAKADRTPKDGIKVLKKEATSASPGSSTGGKSPSKVPAESTATSTQVTHKSSAEGSSPKKRRERGSASIAAMMLQRDLGIGSGASGRRRSRLSNVNDAAGNGKETLLTNSSKVQAAAQIGPSTNKQTLPAGSEEKALLEKPEVKVTSAGVAIKNVEPRKSTSQASSGSKKPLPAAQAPKSSAIRPRGKLSTENISIPQRSPAQGNAYPLQQQSRHAFLKHANASQGISEPLLHDAMSPFGKIEQLTIDKRKGFAYVDFAASEGLRRAMAASPISVAQGAVVVLERREKPVPGHAHAPAPAPAHGHGHPPPPRPHSGGGARGGGVAAHARGSNRAAGSVRGSRPGRGGRASSPAIAPRNDKAQSPAPNTITPATTSVPTNPNVASASAG